MRIVRKDEFGDLSTAVIYKFSKFLPTSNNYQNNEGLRTTVNNARNEYLSEKVLYHGTTKKFNNIDFAEYDFSYILENQKFNSRDLINYLDTESRSKIGNDLVSLEKINSTIFPTLSEETEYDGYEYFGSLALSTVTVYLFNLDPSWYKIELYEDNLIYNSRHRNGNGLSDSFDFVDTDYLKLTAPTFNNDYSYRLGEVVRYSKDGKTSMLYTAIKPTSSGIIPTDTKYWKEFVEPAVTVYLGPEKGAAENPSNWYYPQDPDWYNPRKPLGQGYRELYDEMTSGKAVWLALSKDNTIKELNLSYNAWLLSEDANRYKHLQTIRNDEFYSVKDNFSVVRKDKKGLKDDVIDVRSGNLLGNKKLGDLLTPILNRKQLNEEPYVANNHTYYPYRSELIYKVGDRVYVQNGNDKSLFISVRDKNRAHYPGLSSYWVKSDRVDDCITERVTITPDPISAGSTFPSLQLTVDPENITDRSIKILPSLGYEFSSIVLKKQGGREYELESDNDYELIKVADHEELYSVATIKSECWEDEILSLESLRELYIKFDPIQNIPITSGGYLGRYLISRLGCSSKTGNVMIVPNAKYPEARIVIVKVVVNGIEYTSENDISVALKNLHYGSELSLFFATALGSSVREIEGIQVTLVKDSRVFVPDDLIVYESELIYGNSTIPVTVASFKLLGTSYDYLVSATTDVKIDVTEYDGFEVDKVNIRIATVNEEGQESKDDPTKVINFYGTYKDIFGSLEINYGGNIVTIREPGSEPADLDSIGNATAELVKNDSDGVYSLTLTNIKKYTTIKILGKK